MFNLGVASASPLTESGQKPKEPVPKAKLQLADILEMKGLKRINTKELISAAKDTAERKKYRAQFDKGM